ncbi:MAG: PaaI family thioesterase [Pseudomonas sp.]|uniref:PaaI family thioesterase n=1 Tax=Pseudomonas sp. TaxID=306 RepID=UPI00271CDE50|nr:PaaI family thioesterase [Pseudomonas sp.]MDO9329959.1 PaaI family thioesterase [Pseudomonas sp.]
MLVSQPEGFDMLDALKHINSTSAFNRWAGFEVTAAASGEAELTLAFREADMAQYAGFLHAGLIGALLDTACGFAAGTVAGNVLASHFSVNCLAPAIGEVFIARGRVVKAGKKQVFARAELFAQTGDQLKLVANGDAILVPVDVR